MEKLTSGLHALKDFDMRHFEEKFSRRAPEIVELSTPWSPGIKMVGRFLPTQETMTAFKLRHAVGQAMRNLLAGVSTSSLTETRCV